MPRSLIGIRLARVTRRGTSAARAYLTPARAAPSARHSAFRTARERVAVAAVYHGPLAPPRRAYVWDTTNPPDPTPNCWPTVGATGSVASTTRALGWLGRSVLAGGVQVRGRRGAGDAEGPKLPGSTLDVQRRAGRGVISPRGLLHALRPRRVCGWRDGCSLCVRRCVAAGSCRPSVLSACGVDSA